MQTQLRRTLPKQSTSRLLMHHTASVCAKLRLVDRLVERNPEGSVPNETHPRSVIRCSADPPRAPNPAPWTRIVAFAFSVHAKTHPRSVIRCGCDSPRAPNPAPWTRIVASCIPAYPKMRPRSAICCSGKLSVLRISLRGRESPCGNELPAFLEQTPGRFRSRCGCALVGRADKSAPTGNPPAFFQDETGSAGGTDPGGTDPWCNGPLVEQTPGGTDPWVSFQTGGCAVTRCIILCMTKAPTIGGLPCAGNSFLHCCPLCWWWG